MSNEPTIAEKNRAICEFIGWEFKEDGPDWFKAYHDGRIQWADTKKGFDKILIEGFKYHSSWDWLMPVVIKVNDTLYNMWNDGKMHELVHMEASLRNNFIKFVDKETGWYILDPITGDTLMEALYKAVYQFIQWYNKQKEVTNGN